MADNYLEEKYEQFLKRKDAEHEAKCRIWKKRLEAYRKKLESEKETMDTSTRRKTRTFWVSVSVFAFLIGVAIGHLFL